MLLEHGLEVDVYDVIFFLVLPLFFLSLLFFLSFLSLCLPFACPWLSLLGIFTIL